MIEIDGRLFNSEEYNIENGVTKEPEKRKVIFKPYDQEQTYILPASLEDYVGKYHIARLISVIIDRIDISHIVAKYRGGGTSAYNPRMMLKLWILGYVYRIYTSRMLAKMARENTAFLWISGNQSPDFRTLNDFRKRLDGDIRLVFKEIVRLGLEIGIIKGEDVFIDHTKMEADANKHKMVWKKQVKRQLGKMEDELNILFKYIDELNIKEDGEYGDKDYDEMERDEFDSEMVKGLIDRINKKVQDKEISREEGRESRKKVRRAKELIDRQNDYEEKEKDLGDRNSYSKTDNDAVAMRMKDGITTKPGYNEGIAVENGFVLSYDISDNAADNVSFKDIMDVAIDNIGKTPDNAGTDGAYGNEENYEYLEEKSINAFVKYNTYHKEKSKKWREEKFRLDDFEYNEEKDEYICKNGVILGFEEEKKKKTKTGYEETIRVYKAEEGRCINCPYRERCTKGNRRGLYINLNYNRLKTIARDNLDSDKGKEMRSRRAHEVETVFGDRKWNHGFKRYNLRGIDNVEIEAGLFYSMYNMKKIYVYIFEKWKEMVFSSNFLPALEFK